MINWQIAWKGSGEEFWVKYFGMIFIHTIHYSASLLERLMTFCRRWFWFTVSAICFSFARKYFEYLSWECYVKELDFFNNWNLFYFSQSEYLSDKIYFLYSTGFLIIRTLGMFYFGGSVNDASKKLLSVLREAPTANWCDDVRIYFFFFKNFNSKPM